MLTVVEERRGQERGDGLGRRRAPRLRVLIAAVLDTAAGERPVRIRNLSSAGALIEAETHLAVGERVTLKRGQTVAPADVVWVGDGKAGLHFLQPIQESEVLIHIGKAAAPRG